MLFMFLIGEDQGRKVIIGPTMEADIADIGEATSGPPLCQPGQAS